MAYPVNEEHRALLEEADRLLARLFIEMSAGSLPAEHSFLFFIPALHAIVDRLEQIEKVTPWRGLQQPFTNDLMDVLAREMTDEQLDEIVARRGKN